jgi:hypothetical protein
MIISTMYMKKNDNILYPPHLMVLNPKIFNTIPLKRHCIEPCCLQRFILLPKNKLMKFRYARCISFMDTNILCAINFLLQKTSKRTLGAKSYGLTWKRENAHIVDIRHEPLTFPSLISLLPMASSHLLMSPPPASHFSCSYGRLMLFQAAMALTAS